MTDTLKKPQSAPIWIYGSIKFARTYWSAINLHLARKSHNFFVCLALQQVARWCILGAARAAWCWIAGDNSATMVRSRMWSKRIARSLTNTHTEWNFLPRTGGRTDQIDKRDRKKWKEKVGGLQRTHTHDYMPQQQLAFYYMKRGRAKNFIDCIIPYFFRISKNFYSCAASQPFWMWHFMANFEILYPPAIHWQERAACIIKLLGWLLFSIAPNILKPLKATLLPTHKPANVFSYYTETAVLPKLAKNALWTAFQS